MKKIVLLLNFLLLFIFCYANKEAQVQFIHNIGFEGNETLDVWLSTSKGSEKLIDDLEFRSATTFLSLPANEEITLSFADANSSSIFDTLPTASFSMKLNADDVYVIITESLTEEIGSRFLEFMLTIHNTGKPFIEEDGYVDLLIHHGKKNVISFGLDSNNDEDYFKEIYKNDVLGYLKLPLQNYIIEARDTAMVAEAKPKLFALPLEDTEADNVPLVILASGYLKPLVNFPAYELGLYVATPEGGPLQALQEQKVVNTRFVPFELIVRPNPVDTYLEIPELSDRITSLSLFNLSGIMVANQDDMLDNRIDVSFLPRGTYELVITTASKRISYLKIDKY